jgi:hypothetical protein
MMETGLCGAWMCMWLGGPSFYNRGCNRVHKGVAPSSTSFGVQETKEE